MGVFTAVAIIALLIFLAYLCRGAWRARHNPQPLDLTSSAGTVPGPTDAGVDIGPGI